MASRAFRYAGTFSAMLASAAPPARIGMTDGKGSAREKRGGHDRKKAHGWTDGDSTDWRVQVWCSILCALFAALCTRPFTLPVDADRHSRGFEARSSVEGSPASVPPGGFPYADSPANGAGFAPGAAVFDFYSIPS